MRKLSLCLCLGMWFLGNALVVLAETSVKNSRKPVPGVGVHLKRDAAKIEVFVDGQPFTSYYFQGYDKPVFFPLRAPSGAVVTRGYPMISNVAGEVKDHPHQKGLWLTHGSVNGVDFWTEGPNNGKILHRAFEEISENESRGILKSRNDWISPDGHVVLNEVRVVRIRNWPGLRIMDFDFTLTAANGPVVFGDTKEGSFGIRLAQPFSEDAGGHIENSLGSVGEADCWGKQADWVDFTTKIEGEPVGVAILNHPSSFRFPTYWHVRGYTLFAANPFGLHDFLKDPAKDGSFRLAAGQSMVLRYRVCIHPGTTQEAKIAELFKSYVQEAK